MLQLLAATVVCFRQPVRISPWPRPALCISMMQPTGVVTRKGTGRGARVGDRALCNAPVFVANGVRQFGDILAAPPSKCIAPAHGWAAFARPLICEFNLSPQYFLRVVRSTYALRVRAGLGSTASEHEASVAESDSAGTAALQIDAGAAADAAPALFDADGEDSRRESPETVAAAAAPVLDDSAATGQAAKPADPPAQV